VDTGFLVALAREKDPHHEAAKAFLRDCRYPLVTVSAVIPEVCYFLTPRAKKELLAWVGDEGPSVLDVPVSSYPEIGAAFEKYAERDIDFADAALIWLANETSLRKIVTLDAIDFSLFRLKGGKRFELIGWY
jgi:hypothetical protein